MWEVLGEPEKGKVVGGGQVREAGRGLPYPRPGREGEVGWRQMPQPGKQSGRGGGRIAGRKLPYLTRQSRLPGGVAQGHDVKTQTPDAI